MEINGFEVEIENQYGLEVGAKKSVCPLCSKDRKKSSDKCMTLDWARGTAKCHHCETRIQLHTYKKKSQLKQFKQPVKINSTTLSDKIVNWFDSRGISQFTLKIMKVSQGIEWMPQTGKEENTIQFNYFLDNELINVKYRDGSKNFKMFKDAEKIFYNLDSSHISKDIIIVEGEMDALSFVEVGLHQTVSIPNGATLGTPNLDYINNYLQYFDNKEKIYIALDQDEAGQNVAKELIRRLGADKCFIVNFKDCKDANEYLIKYGNIALQETIKEAKEIPIEGVSSIFDWQEDFEDYLINGMKKGYVIDMESFDKIFSTYTGQYITVTGKPSSGKSDWVDEMCLRFAKNYDWKIAYASAENKPNTRHAGKLLSKICGKWVNRREFLSTAWYKKSLEWIDYHIKFIDSTDGYDLDSILEKAERMVKKFGIKCLCIDPFNKIRLKSSLNKNVNEYANDYLIKIENFATKFDVLVFIVAHPRKPGVQDAKTYEPGFYDIKGGGEFYDMSPHGLLVHRDYENELVMIRVLKVKYAHLGENNAHIYLRWNRDNGRFIDFENQSEDPVLVSDPIIDNKGWFEDAYLAEELTHPLKKPEPIPEVTESNPQKDAVLHNYPKQDTNSDILPNDDFDDFTNINDSTDAPF